MNRMHERVAAQCRDLQECAFKCIYRDAQSQIAAETAFCHIFNEERRSLPEIMDSFQQGNISKIVQSVPCRATFADFQMALSEAVSDASARVVLRYTSASQASCLQMRCVCFFLPKRAPPWPLACQDLGLVSLAPSILRFYAWLHNDFAEFISGKGWSLEDVANVSIGRAVQEQHRETLFSMLM